MVLSQARVTIKRAHVEYAMKFNAVPKKIQMVQVRLLTIKPFAKVVRQLWYRLLIPAHKPKEIPDVMLPT